jgi:predicted O-methyltransferase YrrM
MPETNASAESCSPDRPLADFVADMLARSRHIELPFDYEYDTWVLGKDSMRFLVALTRALQPKKIIEFGSGLSTRILAGEVAGGVIRSFDHSAAYSQRSRAALGAQSCDVDVVHRPVALRCIEGKLLPFYRVRARDYAAVRDADLVFVDGPPGSWGREAALYSAFPHMRRGGLLLLDDAARPGERAAAQAWQARLGAAIDVDFLPTLGKGMLVVRKRENAAQGTAFTLAERRDGLVRTLRAAWRHRPRRARRGGHD